MKTPIVLLLTLLFPLLGCISSFDREWPGMDDDSAGDDDAADDDAADDDAADDDAADDDTGDDDTGGEPDISTLPAAINIDPAPAHVPTTQDLRIRNDGTAPLMISAMPEVSDDHNMMTVHEWTGTIAPGKFQDVAPMVTVTCPSALGSVVNSFSIISDDPDEGVLAVTVNVNCTAPAM